MIISLPSPFLATTLSFVFYLQHEAIFWLLFIHFPIHRENGEEIRKDLKQCLGHDKQVNIIA